MKRSSTAQLDLDFGDGLAASTGIGTAPATSRAQVTGNARTDSSTAAPQFPDFGTSGDGKLWAVTARIAGRINAASISEQEVERLLAERQTLIDRRLDGTITRRECNRLEYIEWTLDRIEDAKYGFHLDMLEAGVARYEKLIADLDVLRNQLSNMIAKKKK